MTSHICILLAFFYILLKLLFLSLMFCCQVLVMPSGDLATVKTIQRDSSSCNLARAGDNIAVGLQGMDPSHLVSGGVICHPDFPVHVASRLELKILVLEITTPILVGLQVSGAAPQSG